MLSHDCRILSHYYLMLSHTIAYYHISSHIIACYPMLFITRYHILSSVMTYCNILPHITTYHRIFFILQCITTYCHMIITYYHIIITYDRISSRIITYDHILSHIITYSQRQPYKNIRISKLNVRALLQTRMDILRGFGWRSRACSWFWLVVLLACTASFQVFKFPSAQVSQPKSDRWPAETRNTSQHKPRN